MGDCRNGEKGERRGETKQQISPTWSEGRGKSSDSECQGGRWEQNMWWVRASLCEVLCAFYIIISSSSNTDDAGVLLLLLLLEESDQEAACHY